MDQLLSTAALVTIGLGGAIALVAWTTTWLDDACARYAARRDAAYRARQSPLSPASPPPGGWGDRDPDADLRAALAALEAEMDRLAALSRQLGGRP